MFAVDRDPQISGSRQARRVACGRCSDTGVILALSARGFQERLGLHDVVHVLKPEGRVASLPDRRDCVFPALDEGKPSVDADPSIKGDVAVEQPYASKRIDGLESPKNPIPPGAAFERRSTQLLCGQRQSQWWTHQLGGDGQLVSESVKGVVELEKLVVGGGGRSGELVEIDAISPPAPLQPGAVPCVVDQHSPHGLGGEPPKKCDLASKCWLPIRRR